MGAAVIDIYKDGQLEQFITKNRNVDLNINVHGTIEGMDKQ